jgi:hypothetical protein
VKIREGFVLRKIMGKNVVVAVGDAGKGFRGMITLNATAADIWALLENGRGEEEICSALLEKYDVEADKLALDVSNILETLKSQGILEE